MTDQAGGSSSIANETTGATPEVLDIISERSDSPKSTDSDDDHIVEAAIRYFEAELNSRHPGYGYH